LNEVVGDFSGGGGRVVRDVEIPEPIGNGDGLALEVMNHGGGLF
jgi:hypothetical protein